jgi:general secretion pathway protein I
VSGSSSRRGRRAGGFTLLEILVAFTILAIALTAIIQAFSQGLRASSVAEERATLVMLARSKLAEVGHSIPLEETEQSGDFEDGLGWQLTIRSPQDSGQDGELDLGEGTDLRAYEVTLRIHRGERSLFEVRSFRVGSEP